MVWSLLLTVLLILYIRLYYRTKALAGGNWDSIQASLRTRLPQPRTLPNPATAYESEHEYAHSSECGNQVTAEQHIVRFTPTPSGVPAGTVYGLTVDKLYMGECEVLPLGDDIEDPAVVCFVRGRQLYVVDSRTVVLDQAF